MANGNRAALTQEERMRVEAAVQAAEQQTSAEIVPMVVAQSGLYREAQHRAGLVSALLVLTGLVTTEIAWLPWGWHATNGLWLLAATSLGYGFGAWIGTRPVLIRFLTSRDRMNRKVQMRAELAFAHHGIGQTRRQTGLLIMVSLLEHQVYVLADKSLIGRVSDAQWQEVVAMMVERLKADDLIGGLCTGVAASGVILARACPSGEGDNPNELSNEVIQDV